MLLKRTIFKYLVESPVKNPAIGFVKINKIMKLIKKSSKVIFLFKICWSSRKNILERIKKLNISISQLYAASNADIRIKKDAEIKVPISLLFMRFFKDCFECILKKYLAHN